MVYFRSASYRTECKAVYLLVGLEGISCELYAHIAQNAGVVAVVRSAVLGTRTALYLHLGVVVHRFSAENHASPVTRTAVAFSLL